MVLFLDVVPVGWHIKKGKYGKFEACSNYPECRHIKKNKRLT
ncbi:MAG: topoisomerase DNA-binding C4 zinc finger domain-containing protein [Thomasclavelia ramosa]